MRLFIAIDLPEEIKDQLEGICRGIPQARWVQREQLHLTLQFVGETDFQLQDIKDALQGVVQEAFPLRIAGVGQFLKRSVPNILWVGVAKQEALQKLHRQVVRSLDAIGLLTERRKFKAHITIARMKAANPKHLQDYLNEYANFQTRPFTVSHLYSSKLRPQGSLHRIEETYDLL